jgi:hypothetical protein
MNVEKLFETYFDENDKREFKSREEVREYIRAVGRDIIEDIHRELRWMEENVNEVVFSYDFEVEEIKQEEEEEEREYQKQEEEFNREWSKDEQD